MEFRVLGALEVWHDGAQVAVTAQKQRAVLVTALLEANRVVSVARLVDAVWGEEPPATAAALILTYVSGLRRVLGADVLLTRPPGYLASVDPDRLDLLRFESHAEQGRQLAAAGDHEAALSAFHSALAQWRGPALDGLDTPVLRAAAGRLDELRLAVIEERVALQLRLNRLETVTAELSGLVAEYPMRERLRAHQMLALYRQGRQAEALDCYQEARAAL